MPNLNVGLGAAMPAFAESFPSNGYMLANKTYSGAATGENMGVYDGTVTASAEYANTLYQIIGGTYLPAGAEVAAQCPANSYCPGVTDATYNESAAQGAKSCPSGYPNSAVGASAITQCYTGCKDSMVEHATAVSGKDYYGDGPDTCFATECENGYHVYETVKVIEQPPLIDVDYTVAGNDSGYISADGGITLNPDAYGLTEKNTWALEFDYGVVYGRASCQAKPYDSGYDYFMANGEAIMGGTMSPDQVRSDLTPIVGVAKANYFADLVAGFLDGTIGEGDFLVRYLLVFGLFEDASFSTSDTGGICYCQMTGFQSASSGESGYDISKAVAIESAPWMNGNNYDSANTCAKMCAYYCAYSLANVDQQRRMTFGGYRVTDVSTCDANEITIKWTDATDEDIAANNAGMCTYGGDIRTPVRAATKPGKTFVGWKFSK